MTHMHGQDKAEGAVYLHRRAPLGSNGASCRQPFGHDTRHEGRGRGVPPASHFLGDSMLDMLLPPAERVTLMLGQGQVKQVAELLLLLMGLKCRPWSLQVKRPLTMQPPSMHSQENDIECRV